MTIDVHIFGAAARGAKADRVPVTIGETAAARDVLAAMAAQHPHLSFALVGARLAVNESFARPEAPIHPNDEIALISLVGGG